MKVKKYENEAYEILGERTDYLWYVTKSSTVDQRRMLRIGDIFINAAVCKKCGDYIRSTNKHDFKYCKCGAVAVDGGSWYGKRVGNPEDMVSIIEPFYDVKIII